MLKRLAIVVSFRSKFDAKTFQRLTKPLILLAKINLERVKGIEPSSQPWEGHILPLNHTRTGQITRKA